MTSVDDLDRPPPDELTFTCPRCGRPTAHRFYGPCPSCREDLRANAPGVQRDVETKEYVPKMNVTPNAVATKD
ncbi:MAG: hypothetical protein ACK5RL_18950 [Acidimicrobiales bacterium]